MFQIYVDEFQRKEELAMITNNYALAVMLLAILVTFLVFVATVISSENEEQQRVLCIEACKWTDWPEGSDAWRSNYQCINTCDKREHDVPKLFDNLSKALSNL
jgi:hypothetical protein